MPKLELTQEELEQKIKDALDAKEEELAKELKAKNEELVGRLKKEKEKSKEAEKAKEREAERAKQDKLEAEGKHEELVTLLRAQIDGLEKDLAKATTSVGEAEQNLKKVLIDKGLSQAFLEAGVTNTSLLEAVVIQHGEMAEIVTNEETKMPEVMIAGKTVDSYLEEWSVGKGKAFIDFGNSGGGAGGGSGDSMSEYEIYFKPVADGGKYNVTKQLELQREDSNEYNRLKEKYKVEDKPLPLNAPAR